jgi:hypothetical protein
MRVLQIGVYPKVAECEDVRRQRVPVEKEKKHVRVIKQLPIKTDAKLDLNKFRYAIQKQVRHEDETETWEPAGFMPTLDRARNHRSYHENFGRVRHLHRIVDIGTGEVVA